MYQGGYLEIRDVIATDAKQIAQIYNHYIQSTFISFEEESVSSQEMSARIEHVQRQNYPWIVALHDDEVIGYAYANTWKPRSAYRYTVEVSVYLSHQKAGKGLGTQLYRQLLERLKANRYENAIGSIALPNHASVRLHERLGFSKVGEFVGIGYKFGEKRTVGYWQLDLQSL